MDNSTANHPFRAAAGATVALGGDGQVTLARSSSRGREESAPHLHQDRISRGFAGGTGRCLTLFEASKRNSRSTRQSLRSASSCQGLAHRSHPAKLEAMLAVATRAFAHHHRREATCRAEQGVVAIGSGGPTRRAQALALLQNTQLGARDIMDKRWAIAADVMHLHQHQRTIRGADERLIAKCSR